MDLYALLPDVIRQRDHNTSPDAFEPRDAYGYNDLSKGPILQRVIDCIQKELDIEATQIEGLPELLDPTQCSTEFLAVLARFLGSQFTGGWSVGRKRLFISSMISLYHTGGTQLCWYAALRLLGYSKSTIYELWKTKANEDTSYSRLEEYDTLAAARIDIDSSTSVELNSSFTELERQVFDNFRPIHVLIRSVALQRAVTDTNTTLAADTQAAVAGFAVSEELEQANDNDIIISVSCARSCETACQSGCTAGCETGCETGCEVNCETGCEVTHEAFYGDVQAIDPATYGPVSLYIVNGQAGTYSGDVSFTEPDTYGPVVLTLVNGLITTVFSGHITGLSGVTGEPVLLYVDSGRFYT